MRRFYRYGCVAAVFAALGGCSFQAAMDKLVSPERQKELIAIGERFCTDPASMTSQLHSGIATSAAEAAPVLPRECPEGKATWQLASYNWKTNVTPGLKQQQEEVVVVGTSPGKWTTVSFRFYAENAGPMQIIEWNVLGSKTKPPALEFIEQYEAGAKTMRIALPVVLLTIGGLVFWLVRRRRAKKRAA
jgi:cysteine synthase